MGNGRDAYRGLVGGSNGPLGRLRHRIEDNKILLQEVEWGCMDWIDLA